MAYLLKETASWYVGGRLEGLALPAHYDFRPLRLTPTELRAEFQRMGWSRVVAFQTRNPLHRAHQELTFRAAREAGANLLLHPSVGMTKPGDVDHYTRVRCYEGLLDRYPPHTVKLAHARLTPRDEDARRHIRKGRAGDFQERLKPETIETVNAKLGPVLEAFGYTVSSARRRG